MRRLPALLLALGLTAQAVPSLVRGQPATGGTEGQVRFRDRKKDNQETIAKGELQESAAGVKVVAGGKTIAVIPPNDIIVVEYARLTGIDPVAMKIVEQKDAAKAQSDYATAIKGGLQDARTKRFAEYKTAALAARVADAKTGEDFAKEAPAAVEKLLTFAREQENAWEVYPTFRTAARLQTELGKHDDAAKIYGQLAKVKGLPADLQQDAKMDEVESLFRAGSGGVAANLVKELTTARDFPKTGPLADRAAVLSAVCTATDPAAAAATAKAVIDKATEPATRAAAHMAVGEMYLQKERFRDAMWELLWVETVYNQDRDEAAKAVARLVVVFDKLGDKERAAAYREKLPRVKLGV